MTNSEVDRRFVKLNHWQYVRPAPTKRYESGFYQTRAIYLCKLCNCEYELSIQSVTSNASTRCTACAATQARRRTWLLINLDTKKTITVVNLKIWCKAHSVDSSTLYRTQKNTNPKRLRNYAKDNKNQRWRIVDKLD